MRKGFTIVELLIYMGLLSILLVVLTQISVSIFDLQSQSKAVSSVAQDGRYILTRLNYDTRRASSISAPALGQTSSTATLVLDGVSTTYDASSGNLVVSSSGSSDQLNSLESNISNLQFRRIGNSGGKNSLEISFTLSSRQNRSSGREIRDYETTIGLRPN